MTGIPAEPVGNVDGGVRTAGEPLTIVSLMAEAGVIFSDGIESDYLEFNAGTRAVIAPAAKKGRLVV